MSCGRPAMVFCGLWDMAMPCLWNAGELMRRQVQVHSGTHGRARLRIPCPLATMTCPQERSQCQWRTGYHASPMVAPRRGGSVERCSWRQPNDVMYLKVIRYGCAYGSRAVDLGMSLSSSGRATFKREWEDKETCLEYRGVLNGVLLKCQTSARRIRSTPGLAGRGHAVLSPLAINRDSVGNEP